MSDANLPKCPEAIEWREMPQEHARPKTSCHCSRMSDRDQFAMAALTGLMANPSHDTLASAEYAHDAYLAADAMMEARK